MYDFDFGFIWGEWGWMLLHGLAVTLQLAAWSLLFSMLIGLFFGMLRWRKVPLFEPLCWMYVEFARNIPPLVQILFWYFSASYILPAPLFGYIRDVGYEFGAAVLALSIYHGSFMAEVFRSGLNAVPSGQYEASRALGLGFGQMMRWVIFPQALRIIIPPLTNETVGLAKNTSLAMAIGVTELTYSTKYIDTYTFRGVEALLAATVLYLALCLSLNGVGQLMDRALSRRTDRKSAVPVAEEQVTLAAAPAGRAERPTVDRG